MAVTLVGSPTAAQTLDRRLTARLDRPPLDRHLWGVAVLDDRGRMVFGRNADRKFMPASNTKLIVTTAATALLGPDATVRTSLYADGPIVAGILAGNLILYGRGDPTWSRRCFTVDTLSVSGCRTDPFQPLAELVAGLKRRGVDRITGAVIGDGSYFEPALVHPTWEHDDLVWGYAAPVSGLGFNESSVLVTITPGSPGEPAAIERWPDLGGLLIENRIVTSADPNDRIEWHREGTVLVATGTIRPGSTPERELLAVPDPNRFAAAALAAVLADSGIRVLGGIGGTVDSTVHATARLGPPIAEIESRPVRDWIFPILNVSQNWVAEMLVKQLGRQLGTGGSWEAGIEVERRFLIDSVGVDSTEFLIHDGSGLSAKNAISPLVFARVLHFIRGHPRYRDFAPGLPKSAAIGSLRRRFVGTPLAGRVRAKTGSIGQVNTLSGFIDQEDPDRAPCRVFSVQANHHGVGGRAMIAAIDTVVVAIGRGTRCARR